MSENIKVRWLTDHEQTKIAPKTLSTQIMNEDGTRFKDTVESAIVNAEAQTTAHASNNDIHVTAEEKEAWNSIEVPSLDGYATKEYVESLVKKLSATLALSFYCIEDVTVITNGIPKVYPANSNVEIVFADEDVFEIVPTSDQSILALTAFPGALGTYYPWLEGVAQFSNILFDMNDVDMYSKWSQGNQGAYHVQKAQYTNCIFWSDNPYISDVSKRTNYTLTHTSQLPLCYSTIPDNTFKAFYLAFGVNSDPNWGNDLYKDSFAKATWATQVFSYYGARTIGIVGHDDPDFNIVLPKDCRGLMFDARHIENAGTFDAINVTNFGAKSGSWREAFGFCPSLKRLYIKNLKVSLNISWSPIDYDSISYIISAAANTSAITISVSPYTYNLLSPADFTAAANKNITIALITTNYVEDRRLNTIADKADKDHTHTEYMSATNPVGTGSFSMNRKAGTTVGDCSSTFGINCTASGTHSHAEGYGTIAYGNYSHAEGYSTTASANYSHAEGYLTKASGTYSHAEGSSTIASGGYSHAEGRGTAASGANSHVEGRNTIARGDSSHAEGYNTKANGDYSHAEGYFTEATGIYSHAEGTDTKATGSNSHAEGSTTLAIGASSHAEGCHTLASGSYSHSEGMGESLSKVISGNANVKTYSINDTSELTVGAVVVYEDSFAKVTAFDTTNNTITLNNTLSDTALDNATVKVYVSGVASGAYSHSEGKNIIAQFEAQHVQGRNNVVDSYNRYAHIVGNGQSSNARSNAHTLDWSGNAWFAGDVYVGSTSGTNKDDGSEKLAKISDVPVNVSQLANDSGFLTSYTETDPTVPAWAKASTKPTYTASEVGADVAGTADTLVSTHANNKSNPHEVTAAQLGLKTESWTFTLEDGSTVTKVVYVG